MTQYENAVELNNVSKHYRDFGIQSVSLTVPKGYIVGLVGKNGAGKSTIIRMLTGAARPDSGEISVLGKKTTDRDFDKVKEDVGVVFDYSGYPPNITASEVGKIMNRIYRSWERRTYADYLEKFGVPTDKKFSEFSQGMKMKMSVAAALSHGAKLLILDEATNGLDPVARDETVRIIGEYTRDPEKSVLITSHIVSDLEKICDYVSLISGGKIIAGGEKESLEQRYRIISLTEKEYAALDKKAVVGIHEERYGVRVMIDAELYGDPSAGDSADIEDLMIFMSGGKNS